MRVAPGHRPAGRLRAARTTRRGVVHIFLERQGGRADHAGLTPKTRGANGDAAAAGCECGAVEGRGEWGQQQIAGFGDRAVDDHRARVDDLDHLSKCKPEALRHLRNACPRSLVSPERELHEL